MKALVTGVKGQLGFDCIKELEKRGFVVNHKRVQRLMHCMELRGKRPKEKYHSYQGNVGKIADNVINRDFSATAPLQKWTTDVSQFNFSWGKCYISPILDMYTNEIISYDLSQSPNLEQVQRMLNRAFKKFSNVDGLIFHSDQGWQYQMYPYKMILKDKGIIQSMSRKGNCLDNSLMENFFGIMKNEMFYGHEYEFKSLEELEEVMVKYIEYYNNERIMEKTKGLSPLTYRQQSFVQLGC